MHNTGTAIAVATLLLTIDLNPTVWTFFQNPRGERPQKLNPPYFHDAGTRLLLHTCGCPTVKPHARQVMPTGK